MNFRTEVLHAAETAKGGVSTVLSQLLNSSSGRVSCLTPVGHEPEGEFRPEVRLWSYSRTGRNFVSLTRFVAAFARAIYSERPAVVHLHSTFAGAICRPLLFILRPIYSPLVVYAPHGFSFLMEIAPWKKRLYAAIERVLSLATTNIICVSEYERREAILRGLPADKIKLVYNGVERRRRPSNAQGSGGHRRRYEDRLRAIFVGRLDRQKGFDTLVEAMGLVEDGTWELQVVGASVAGPRANLPVNRYIQYLGWLSRAEVLRRLAAADVLICPSRWEGFALVPLEAMAAGLPVIASDATSLPELVVDGENGRLFPAGDAHSLAEIMRGMSRKELREMGLHAREHVERRFSVTAMVRNTFSLYRAR